MEMSENRNKLHELQLKRDECAKKNRVECYACALCVMQNDCELVKELNAQYERCVKEETKNNLEGGK